MPEAIAAARRGMAVLRASIPAGVSAPVTVPILMTVAAGAIPTAVAVAIAAMRSWIVPMPAAMAIHMT